MNRYILLALFSGVLSAFSQVLLKKSAASEHKSRKGEYFNIYVIGGYAILFVCMIIMVFAFRGMPLKYGPIIESLAYLYSMVLGKIFFDERITRRRIVGNMIIVCGILIFSIG